MRGRLRRWLVQRFLPAWAKETIMEENESLRRQLDRLRRENERLRAYADGLEQGLYAVRGMCINVTMEGKGECAHGAPAGDMG